MTFITGDKHGNFEHYKYYMKKIGASADDVCIICGDVGLNFFRDEKDIERKSFVNNLPLTTFCVHGNHEIRPQNILSYTEKTFYGGKVLYEQAFPNIVFAIDGEVYDFDGYKCLVIGGAYSVDKQWRLAKKYGWWADEQPDAATKDKVENTIMSLGGKVDAVISHTCPTKYIPLEMFSSSIDSSTVDRSTEDWLDKVEDSLEYKKWFCGHWHTDKTVDKIHFLYDSFVSLQ